MKKIIPLFLTIICIVFSCASLYSCENLESNVNAGIQYVCGERVCTETNETSSIIYPIKEYFIYEKMLYVTADMRVYESERSADDIQSVWNEVGTFTEDSLDFRFIDSESDWTEGHSLQHITENIERTYSLLTKDNVTMQLILLKDRTAYLAVCTNSTETVFLLEETEISYYEDTKRPSFEIFTYSVTGNTGEILLVTTKSLCLYNNRTEFFLQCAENEAGGIHGKVTETTDGLLLEAQNGKYKIAVDTNDENWSFSVETPECIKFSDEISGSTGTSVRKIGEYYNFLEENEECFDTWEADFDGNGEKERITFHRFPYSGITPLSTVIIKAPSYSLNAAVWENGKIKYFVFLPFENKVSGVHFYKDGDDLFAEMDEVKYEWKQYSGVSLPGYFEEKIETVIYKVTIDEKGLAFIKE